jgi:hypothetical protein
MSCPTVESSSCSWNRPPSCLAISSVGTYIFVSAAFSHSPEGTRHDAVPNDIKSAQRKNPLPTKYLHPVVEAAGYCFNTWEIIFRHSTIHAYPNKTEVISAKEKKISLGIE